MAKRLVVQGHFLHHPQSGQGVFTMEMVRAFVASGARIAVLLWYSTSEDKETLTRRCTELGVTEVVWCFLPAWLPLRLRLLWWEMIWIPRYLAKQRDDVVYFSPTLHPLLWHTRRVPLHMTLHDVFPFTEQAYARGWTRRLYNALLRRTARHGAVTLHTVSQTSAEAIRRVLKVTAPLHVAGNGIDHLQQESPEDWATTQAETGIRGPYLLYQGGYDKRKNVPVLLRVFPRLRARFPDLQLVLCGNALHASPLYADPAAWAREPGVVFTGFVSRARLRTLFAHASAVVSPTRAEGFNIVIGEALMEGTTVVASDIPVHRELWADHALLVDFSREEEVISLLDAILRSERTSPPLSPAERSARSWKSQAGKILRSLLY